MKQEKQITSADQLVDGKKYWLQSEFSLTRYESRFWEADKHTAWFTTYMPNARVIGWAGPGITFTNRQELFDLLAEMKVKIYEK